MPRRTTEGFRFWEEDGKELQTFIRVAFIWSENSRKVYAIDRSFTGKDSKRQKRDLERRVADVLRRLNQTTVRIPSQLVCDLPSFTGIRGPWLTVETSFQKEK